MHVYLFNIQFEKKMKKRQEKKNSKKIRTAKIVSVSFITWFIRFIINFELGKYRYILGGKQIFVLINYLHLNDWI